MQYSYSIWVSSVMRSSHFTIHHSDIHMESNLLVSIFTHMVADDWLNKGHSMCYHACVIKHLKDPKLSVARVEHCVQVEGFFIHL